MNAAYYFSLLVFNLAYLFDSSKYHSPWLWLIGTRIRRMGRADHAAIEAATRPVEVTPRSTHRPGQLSSMMSALNLGRTMYSHALSSFRFLLPASIFALKFLEWWHASDFARQLSRKATEALDLPPPILSDSKDSKHILRTKLDVSSNSKGKDNTKARHKPPISSTTHCPIFTVPPPNKMTSALCPICLHSVVTATASSYGFVYCYVCIHKWVEGTHERQEAFMQGGSEEENAWGEESGGSDDEKNSAGTSREGRWESGQGRCAVTGKRILGGTEGLRRVVV